MNIKNIGKELLGKSLNSFHRKTGLTQLEKNNEMQDGILNGILSQVDDAYIEKTEQSNVIHLDGSGDGVVVVDGVEGNTMVNLGKDVNPPIGNHENFESIELIDKGDYVEYKMINALTVGVTPRTDWSYKMNIDLVKGKTYTVIIPNMPLTLYNRNFLLRDIANAINYSSPNNVTTWSFVATENGNKNYAFYMYTTNSFNLGDTITCNMPKKIVILEGDYTNKEINYFEGLQSSFEEKKEEDKYKIEILSQNKNILNSEPMSSSGGDRVYLECTLKPNTDYKLSFKDLHFNSYRVMLCTKELDESNRNIELMQINIGGTTSFNSGNYSGDLCILFHASSAYERYITQSAWIQLEKGLDATSYIPHKQNKIKLSMNEPLRSVDNIKDRLCIKDGVLTIERNCTEKILNGSSVENWSLLDNSTTDTIGFSIRKNHMFDIRKTGDKYKKVLNEKYPTYTHNLWNNDKEGFVAENNINSDLNDVQLQFRINKNKLNTIDTNGLCEYLIENNLKIVFAIEPYYEEVLNEYGEPIILEGYENGTLYIDSVIVPTTTVRYTPKMESFKTLKEVENNNVMLTYDVNENIIPYMMEVDFMIMEKEMALLSQLNTRRVGTKIMTDMQRRTKEMLERLIKGKSLTKEDAKTRVTTYLDAGKITDAQAEELMLLISEVYA